mmetsp:Transcript_25530/g.64905  ORF Transcript_25530/g.64905 Transcript_25530/m.64905 type:complete len:271 (-) Transcript_25530:424-1236(-)
MCGRLRLVVLSLSLLLLESLLHLTLSLSHHVLELRELALGVPHFRLRRLLRLAQHKVCKLKVLNLAAKGLQHLLLSTRLALLLRVLLGMCVRQRRLERLNPVVCCTALRLQPLAILALLRLQCRHETLRAALLLLPPHDLFLLVGCQRNILALLFLGFACEMLDALVLPCLLGRQQAPMEVKPFAELLCPGYLALLPALKLSPFHEMRISALILKAAGVLKRQVVVVSRRCEQQDRLVLETPMVEEREGMGRRPLRELFFELARRVAFVI